jgi:alpha-tubulin suppressor-like RCC1 family protein
LGTESGVELTAKSVALAQNHTCAILSNDKLKCWGSGSDGHLAPIVDSGAPDLMGDGLNPVNFGNGMLAVSVSTNRESVCAVLADDSVKCWGKGQGGALGNGSLGNIGGTTGSMGTNLPVVDLRL